MNPEKWLERARELREEAAALEQHARDYQHAQMLRSQAQQLSAQADAIETPMREAHEAPKVPEAHEAAPLSGLEMQVHMLRQLGVPL